MNPYALTTKYSAPPPIKKHAFPQTPTPGGRGRGAITIRPFTTRYFEVNPNAIII